MLTPDGEGSSTMIRRRVRWELLLFGMLFLSVTAYFTYGIAWGCKRQHEAHTSFVPVEAHVESSRVKEWTSSSGSTRSTSYAPKIEYRYTIDGVEYRSDRYWFTGRGCSRYESAKWIVEQYPTGSMVTAYVDPRDASAAVLNRAPPPTASLAVTIGIFWVLGGAFCLGAFFGRRQG